MRLFPANVHKWIYFTGLAAIAVGMPLSAFLMSVGQLVIAGNFLLGGSQVEKFKRFWKNKAAVVAASVILMHALGLLYTSDFKYGMADILVKIPLIVLPIVLAGSEPISRQWFNWLLALFVAAVFAGTAVSVGVYYGIVHTKKPVVDIRDISIFISHIRFSLMICLSILIVGYYIFQETNWTKKIVGVVLVTWFVIFLTILNSLTGIGILLTITFVLVVYTFFTWRETSIRIMKLFMVITIIIGSTMFLKPYTKTSEPPHKYDYSHLEMKTVLGHPYTHNLLNTETENGNKVWVYVCWDEMEQAWNARSKVGFNEKNRKGDEVKYTLLRFLTSKGLRKDAGSVQSLSKLEIMAIENGVANVNYMDKPGISVRLMETFWELDNYKKGHDVNGHSVAMRPEFWRAAIGIIKKNPILGVGTGDVKNEFAKEYDEINSQLDAGHRLRAHNQYLAITVAFGIIGLIWFLITLIYPMIKTGMTFNYFYAVFFIISVLSMFTEDTLESQAGVTFFAFFSSLFLFGQNNNQEDKTSV